jgi:hypothetical protein
MPLTLVGCGSKAGSKDSKAGNKTGSQKKRVQKKKPFA